MSSELTVWYTFQFVSCQEPGTLWIHSVSQEVADSVSETERKRQEAINEVIYTERDFVRDMEYLRDVSFILILLILLYFVITL